ncbi:hypothetical protein G6L08_35410 [Agrobacterium rhizogenes]|nr:hypothetical protein [Rhizobium rhizogenes]
MAKERSLEKRIALVVPELLESDQWLSRLRFMDQCDLRSKLEKELFQVGGLALTAVRLGKINAAVNWLSLGFYCDQSATRDSLGTAGTFRASKYRYRTEYLLETLSALDNVATELALTPEVLNYLGSVRMLVRLSPAVGQIDQNLRVFLKRNSDVALKAVVARIDALFMIGHQGDHIGSTDEISTYPVEELAEGASYIIHCIDEEIGISECHFGLIPEEQIAKGVFDKLIIKACKIRRYAEAEILIDAFDYRCIKRGRETIITAPTPELEKSIRLGYIQNEQARDQGRLMRDKSLEEGGTSVYALADQFFDRLHDRVVKRLDTPIARYTFQIPDVPPIRSMFQADAVTVEEDFYLREIGNSELVSWEELKDFEFGQGLTLLDLSKVHRLFMFLARLAMRQLAPLLEDDPVLAYRSLVPVFKEKDLKGLIGWCVKEDQVDTVLEFLSHRPGVQGIFDMQYKPIIHAQNYYLVPLHVAGMTNWYRNFARSEDHRLIDSLSTDAAERALAADLRRANCSQVAEGFETVFKKQRIEIDVVCRFGDFLFLFECKHPVLPCNAHELRTSYKHMRTGARQLSDIKSLLSDPEVEREFYRRLGWACEPADEMVTCIVSANGMFSGLRINGHPVRRMAELSNMIRTGVLRTMRGSMERRDGRPVVRTDDVIERTLWSGPTLTPEFLYEYLQNDPLSKMLFDGMLEYEQTYSLDEGRLTFVSYALDGEAVTDAIAALPRSPTEEVPNESN